jgi:uncharacterized protein YyaL (SSP411 family)
MAFLQATTGAGGWPMSVFLTPDLAPFFAGTYFPPADAGGRIGFPSLLRRVADLWAARREEVVAQGEGALRALGAAAGAGAGGAAATVGAAAEVRGVSLQRVADQLGRQFDARHGGFGGAPKFPRPAELLALLAQADRAAALGRPEEAARARGMAVQTLDAMAAGGVRDQLGGGFTRYSVDELWHVPHFE